MICHLLLFRVTPLWKTCRDLYWLFCSLIEVHRLVSFFVLLQSLIFPASAGWTGVGCACMPLILRTPSKVTPQGLFQSTICNSLSAGGARADWVNRDHFPFAEGLQVTVSHWISGSLKLCFPLPCVLPSEYRCFGGPLSCCAHVAWNQNCQKLSSSLYLELQEQIKKPREWDLVYLMHHIDAWAVLTRFSLSELRWWQSLSHTHPSSCSSNDGTQQVWGN